MSDFIREAFEQICTEAKKSQSFYVCLMERSPFYGGPEEGGWWGEDHNLIAYQHCQTEEEADKLVDKITEYAGHLSQEERKSHGQHCLNQMEWLENRMLEPDFLPELDGPSEYYVTKTDELPKSSRGNRQYC